MMTLEEAIILLKNAVKYSAVPGQKHIDLSLVGVEDLPSYQKALTVVNSAVAKGEIAREKVMAQLGLK